MTLRWRRWRRVVAIEGVRDWWAASDRRRRLGSFAWRRLVLDEHTRCAVFDRFRGLLSTSCDGAHIDFFIRSETGVDGDDPDGRNDATGTSAAGVTRRLISPLFVQCLCSVPPTRADPSPLHAARNLWPRRRPSLPIQTATNRLVVQTVESHACLPPFSSASLAARHTPGAPAGGALDWSHRPPIVLPLFAPNTWYNSCCVGILPFRICGLLRREFTLVSGAGYSCRPFLKSALRTVRVTGGARMRRYLLPGVRAVLSSMAVH